MNNHFFEKMSEDKFNPEDLLRRQELVLIINNHRKSIDDFEYVTEEALEFKKTHSDCYDYLLFHDLIGSTPPAFVNKFDTENHEIENLIRNLPQKARQAA